MVKLILTPLTSIICIAAVTLVVAAPAMSEETSLDKDIRRGNAKAIREGYKKYQNSRNATYRENMKELLQSTLDIAPTTLLSIRGVNVENFCDGSDIDVNPDISSSQAIERIEKRIMVVKASTLNSLTKDRCIAELQRFISCAKSPNC